MIKTATPASLACALALSAAPHLAADIDLYDIDSDPDAWQDAIAGLDVSNGYDFDLDPDYGIEGFDGPLTSAGAGPVSPGILPDKITLDRINLGGGDPGLVAVGPSGFGGCCNAILANFFIDAFAISFEDPKVAFEFSAVSVLGGDAIDITVVDQDGERSLFSGVEIDPLGHRSIGIRATEGQRIASIELHDPLDGAEGVSGSGTTYVPAPPAAVALLGACGLRRGRRRRG